MKKVVLAVLFICVVGTLVFAEDEYKGDTTQNDELFYYSNTLTKEQVGYLQNREHKRNLGLGMMLLGMGVTGTQYRPNNILTNAFSLYMGYYGAINMYALTKKEKARYVKISPETIAIYKRYIGILGITYNVSVYLSSTSGEENSLFSFPQDKTILNTGLLISFIGSSYLFYDSYNKQEMPSENTEDTYLNPILVPGYMGISLSKRF